MSSDEGSGYRALAANVGFRRLWLSQTVSRVGDSIHYVALVIFVFDLTGSAVSVSAAVIFEALPVVLLGAFAGAVVDRYRRRSVMIVADLGRAVLALLVASAGSVWEIYALAFGLSLGGLVHTPSAQALLPNLVETDQLGRANAALWSGVQSVHVLGSVIGGALVALVGPRGAFVVNAGTFVLSAVLIAGVTEPGRQHSASTTTKGFADEIRVGVAHAFGDRFLRRLLVVQFLAVLSVGGTGALFVVLARDQLGVDSTRFGGLVAAIGLGAFVGPLLTGRFLDRHGTTAWVFGPYVVRGGIDAALAFLRGFWLPAGLLFVYGVNTSTGGVAYTTILQRRVPDQFRGRVFTTLGVTWQLGRLVSIGLAGVAVDAVSIQALYLAAGGLLVLAGVLGLRLLAGAADDLPT